MEFDTAHGLCRRRGLVTGEVAVTDLPWHRGTGEVAGGRSKATWPACCCPPTHSASTGWNPAGGRAREATRQHADSFLAAARAPRPFNRAPFASRPMVGPQRAGGRRRRQQHPKQRRAAAAEGPWRRRRRSSTRPPGWWPPSASSSSPSPSPPSASSTTSARYALR